LFLRRRKPVAVVGWAGNGHLRLQGLVAFGAASAGTASDRNDAITVAAATAVRRAIAFVTGLEVRIKWPNDILVHGKKIAGILTELRAELDQVKYVILGVGVDVT